MKLAETLRNTIIESPYDQNAKIIQHLLREIDLLEKIESYLNAMKEAEAMALLGDFSPVSASHVSAQLPQGPQAASPCEVADQETTQHESLYQKALTQDESPRLDDLLDRQQLQLRVVFWSADLAQRQREAKIQTMKHSTVACQ